MIKACGKSDIGTARSRNEDAWHLDLAQGLAVIADGLGGAAAGSVASDTVVATLRVLLLRTPPSSLPDDESLRAAFHRTNELLLEKASTRPEWTGMGSTALITCWNDVELVIAHVGDCRAYLLRARKLVQLTTDHTLVAVLQAEHGLSAAEARAHPLRHQLLASLGAASLTPPVIYRARWRAGDRLLLCSDGLWGAVDQTVLQSRLRQRATAEETVTALFDAVQKRGAPDNLTAIVIDYTESA